MKSATTFALISPLLSGFAGAAVISYPDFSSVAGLTLNGDAAQVGAVLRLAPEAGYQSGSAFSTTPVSLAQNASFSTAFQFRISKPTFGIGDGDGVGADGLVFVVQTVSNGVGGAGGGIGYQGIPKSLGVEFDTYDNGSGLGDPDGNHVNFDFGGVFSPAANAVSLADRMNNGDVWNAWVDYDGATDLLELRLAMSTTRPASALLSATVDLPTVLGATDVYAGFTAGTGSGVGNHDILSWQFRDTYNPIPEPSTTALAMGLVAGVAGFIARRRRV